MSKKLSDFAARLRLAMARQARQAPDDEFNKLALELFALQFKHNTAYRKICEAQGNTPGTAEHWTQIPAVPTSAFKELELTCLPAEERTAVFHSSGTTEQRPGRHFHGAESLEIYETALWAWFQRHLVPEFGVRSSEFGVLILTPPLAQAPHSSLVHMFEVVRSRVCENAERSFLGTVAADGSWILDFDAVLSELDDNPKLKTKNPQFILGTAFSFVHLLDYLAAKNLHFHLPAGSRVMETGGYKNRSRALPKEELHALIAERLGVAPENIICEYGMSELSSQAYDSVAGDEWRVTGKGAVSRRLSPVTRHFEFPPWARAQIVSAETGREVGEGETGLIRVFDLANVFSVMAVQTEDLGIRRSDGFELIGRAQVAEPRGCSLMSA